MNKAKEIIKIFEQIEFDPGSDEDAKRELDLFIENDADLYRSQLIPIVKNLMTKMKRGVYDHSLAPKLWSYLIEAGAKKYIREFGGPGDRMQNIFPKKLRDELAKEYADGYYEEIKLGSYDELIPGFKGREMEGAE